MRQKKGFNILLAAAVLSLGLTGCGENQIPDLTEEEMRQVGEFVAITMMKYDINHKSRLMDLVEVEAVPEENVPESEEPSGMGPVEDTPVVDAVGTEDTPEGSYSLEMVMGLPEGVNISFLEHTVCDSYPDDGEIPSGGFSLDASEGKKLLVLHFSLTDTTGQEQSIDLFSSDAVYTVTVNGEYSRRALTTMLLDDLATYKGSLSAGGSAEAVLVIEVEDGMAEAITSLSLKVKNGENAHTIQLLNEMLSK